MPSPMTSRRKLKEVYPHFSLKGYGEEIEQYQPVVDSDQAEVIYKSVEMKQPSDSDINDTEKSIISYINTLAMDRDMEVVLPDGAVLDHYAKNPTVLLSHDYWGSNTGGISLGRNAWVKKDKKGLIAKTIYNQSSEDAMRVYESRKAGFPMMESIGFIPLEWIGRSDSEYVKVYNSWAKAYKRAYGVDHDESMGTPRYFITRWLLLEYSDVLVGSNPDALEIAEDADTKKGIDSEGGIFASGEVIQKMAEAGIIPDDAIEERHKTVESDEDKSNELKQAISEVKIAITELSEWAKSMEKRLKSIESPSNQDTEQVKQSAKQEQPVRKEKNVMTIEQARLLAINTAQEEALRRRGIAQI